MYSADGSLRLFWIKSGAVDNKFARIPTHSGLTVDPLPEPTFEVAPAGAINNWNYTLDDTNNIVTLNYYTGRETDVTVWGSYPIGGKTYTTRLASNTEDATLTTSYMFNREAQSNCQYIQKITFSNRIDTSNVTNMSYMFNRMGGNLTSLDVSGLNTSDVKNMKGMFRSCNNLQTLNVSNFDTSKVINMQEMFSYCSALTTLNVSNFDTSKVINMQGMFDFCIKLTSLDVSGFNTSNVTNMQSMFSRCYALTTLNLSNFNTSNVTNMQSMFQDCWALTALDVSKFNTSNVTNMQSMFQDCDSLATLDLSNFETPKVTNMNRMFSVCNVLTTLNLSNFDTSNVTDMSYMFCNSTKLTTLKTAPASEKKWVRKSGCIVEKMIYDSGLSSSSIPPIVS